MGDVFWSASSNLQTDPFSEVAWRVRFEMSDSFSQHVSLTQDRSGCAQQRRSKTVPLLDSRVHLSVFLFRRDVSR